MICLRWRFVISDLVGFGAESNLMCSFLILCGKQLGGSLLVLGRSARKEKASGIAASSSEEIPSFLLIIYFGSPLAVLLAVL